MLPAMSAGFSAPGLAAGFTFSAAPHLGSGMASGGELRRAVGVRGGDKASPGLGQAPPSGMEWEEGALQAGGAFSRRREGSREEGDGSDKLGKTKKFWKNANAEIF
uniref:Gpm274 n=1 Tax=Arundo donax TaxID=35708 RepID=A0A0A9H973_ARUDO